MTQCELCGDEAFNEHHLIPRHCHRKAWFKNRFSKAEMQHTIDVCKICHKMIHQLVPDEKELGRHYHSIEALSAHPQLDHYLQWKRKRVRT